MVGDRPAVDFDKLARASALCVNVVRQNVFADAGLAKQQNRRIVSRKAIRQRDDPVHHAAAVDDLAARVDVVLDLL